jgi:hypothetical protein
MKRPIFKFYLNVSLLYLFILICLYTLHNLRGVLILLALGPALIFLIGLSQYVLAQALHESWHFYSRTPKQKFTL